MPWFPAWGIKFDKQIIDFKEVLTSFNDIKPDSNWLLLAFDVAASEKHLWTAWYSMKRNQMRNKMIANSPDAEFLRIISGTHQVRIAFENAGIRNGDFSAWIVRLPQIQITKKIEENSIFREIYNTYDKDANNLIERMNGNLITQRPKPSSIGLKRIKYEHEVNEEKSLEECFLLHLISSNL
tara:strand:- start:3164 stop:3709 length:546 start_codon:yes stop_codon:yes gene_type:complete